MALVKTLIQFLVKQSQKKHSVVMRAIVTFLGAALFMAGIPACVVWAGRFLSGVLVLPASLAQILSLICFIIGIPWMLSAVFWQLLRGKGTPVPVIPTKQFLQNGPYRYLRNPMMLGFFLYLLGWAFLSNRWLALGATLLFMGLLLMEIRLIEEPELEKRFGQAYREYKKETPFMFPKIVR